MKDIIFPSHRQDYRKAVPFVIMPGGRNPQIEAYNMSRHGTTYRAKIDQMNLHDAQWIVGQDYVAAPTCATCHMSGARDLPATHNINERLDNSRRNDEKEYPDIIS